MNLRSAFFPVVVIGLVSNAGAQDATAELGRGLAGVYSSWRTSIVSKDFGGWQRVTAPHRQAEIRNRLISEKRPFPGAVFDLPAPPPKLDGLKLINVSQNGATAKVAWFGKIDFGGGTPTDNVMVVSFVNAGGSWRYDKADFVNLTGLPDVRKELAEGNLAYVSQTPDFKATGKIPATPPEANSPKYIAKVYVFCPGREVEVQVNQLSRHHFTNAQEAEIVIGGAKDGANTVTYTAKQIEGGKGNEALAVRVYLMPEVEGQQPIKAYEYRVDEGGTAKSFGTSTFTVDPAVAGKLLPR
ncbi:MAG: hypothetical protein JWO82_3656 [Akkermansiaceae bacterium]|nr:hypothetical protein [Akkermansiaceae bacterium]